MQKLSLDLAALDQVFNTAAFKAERTAQYGAVEKSDLAEKVLCNQELTDQEVEQLLANGEKLWSFISTLGNGLGFALGAISWRDDRALCETVVNQLARLPEGPFFYAVRMLFDETGGNTLNNTFKEVIKELVYFDSYDEFDAKTGPAYIAEQRMKGLGRMLNMQRTGVPEAHVEWLPGCALAYDVLQALVTGSTAVEPDETVVATKSGPSL